MEKKRFSPIRTVISMMMSPSSILKSFALEIPWFFSVLVSAAAFGLFFLQTGLDLYKTGQKSFEFVLLSTGAGVLYGTILIPLLGVVVWIALKIARTEKKIKFAISSFCLSYSGALIYGILGLCFSIFLGWRTSIAFGVTGVLWATGPMITGIREMTGGKTALSILLSAVTGAFILYSWSFFGRI